MTSKRSAASTAAGNNPKKAATTPAASQEGTAGVPLAKLATDPAASGSVQAEPAEPPCPHIMRDADDAGVLTNMRGIFPYVRFRLKEALRTTEELSRQFPDVEPHEHQPSNIADVEGLKADDLSSFKHPWEASKAEASLDGTSMYEAAGNVLWCDPMPPLSGDEGIIAGDLPTWQNVEEIVSSHFSMESAHSQRSTHRPTVSRLIFPSVVMVILEDVGQATAQSFKASLKVLAEHVGLGATRCFKR